MIRPAGIVLTAAQARGHADYIKSLDKRVGFTNGCFDILHPGHLKVIRATYEQSYCVIVGLNSDTSINQIYGRRKPVNDSSTRAQMLCALRWVHIVVLFSEPTPLELIKQIRPDVLVKGGEYGEGEIVGEEFVRLQGGEIVRVPMIEGYSTTNLIERIRG